MRIYIVTKGNYSDYHIIAATMDYNLAESIKKKFDSYYNGARIEVFEDAELMMKPIWSLKFDREGNVQQCVCNDEYATEYNYIDHGKCFKAGFGVLEMYVAADDEESAIKIGREKRAQYLAQENGL